MNGVDFSMWVLVVDDHANIRELTFKALNNLGFCNVEDADDGTTALMKLEKKTFGLIISDLEMMPLDGMDLLKAVRQQPGTQKTPFIVLTSDNMSKTVKKTASAGANHYLVKPFTTAKLKASIERVLLTD